MHPFLLNRELTQVYLSLTTWTNSWLPCTHWYQWIILCWEHCLHLLRQAVLPSHLQNWQRHCGLGQNPKLQTQNQTQTQDNNKAPTSRCLHPTIGVLTNAAPSLLLLSHCCGMIHLFCCLVGHNFCFLYWCWLLWNVKDILPLVVLQ